MQVVSDLEVMLDGLGVESGTVGSGRPPVRAKANAKLHNIIRNLRCKTKKLESTVQKWKGKHANALATFWTAQAGLSDPKTSQRSVQSWCQEIWFR